jgi:Fasciclin domain
MKLVPILSVAALAAAWVVPDEQVISELSVEDHREKSFWDNLPSKESIVEYFNDKEKVVENQLDEILDWWNFDSEYLHDKIEEEAYNVNAWLDEAIQRNFEFEDIEDDPHHPPHHGPPGKRPHHPPPGKRPHHPPHHDHPKPNETIYQLISKSKYTTKLAKLIDEDADLVKLLNSTKANHTIFAPTDFAFKKIPDDAPKPPKEVIKKVLLYHVAPGLYPAGRVLFDHTVPTALEEPLLGDAPQRIAARLGFRGLTLNFYSRVIAANIVR